MRRADWVYIAFFAACLAAGIASELAIGKEYFKSTEVHIVEPRETVWEIAGLYFERQNRYRHFGEFVYSIEQANGGGGIIHPGQKLAIPLETELETENVMRTSSRKMKSPPDGQKEDRK